MDGSTTISPVEEQQPTDTENISVLDSSSESKNTDNSEKLQLEDEKNAAELNLFAEDLREAEAEREATWREEAV